MVTDIDFWSSFKLRISIKKDLNTLYKSWTTQKGLESWFLESAKWTSKNGTARDKSYTASVGDTSNWKWHNWDMQQDTTILEANGTNILVFTFGKGGNVRIELKEKGNFTEVTLTQFDIPTNEQSRRSFHLGCTKGWTFWLTNLKSYLEHGIVLNVTGLTAEETKYLVNS